jgi:hypothetical protein
VKGRAVGTVEAEAVVGTLEAVVETVEAEVAAGTPEAVVVEMPEAVVVEMLEAAVEMPEAVAGAEVGLG